MVKPKLEDIYYNTLSGYGGAQKLYEKVKKHYTMAQVKAFLREQEPAQILNAKVEIYHFPIVAPDGTYNMDVTTVDGRKILCCIEMTSRKAYARFITHETQEDTKKEFTAMNIPDIKVLATDDGGNFKGIFDAYLKAQNIKRIIYTGLYKNFKNSTVERFNRTIKKLIHTYTTATDKKPTQHVLDELMRNYNSSWHSSIRMAPGDVKKVDMPFIRGMNTERYLLAKSKSDKYAIGNKVRVRLGRNKFDKEKDKWTYTIYTITGKDKNRFILDDDDDLKFMYYDLLKVKGEAQRINKDKREERTGEENETRLLKKQVRDLNREGIDKEEVIEGKRERKASQLPPAETAPVVKKKKDDLIVVKVLGHRVQDKVIEFEVLYKHLDDPRWQPAKDFIFRDAQGDRAWSKLVYNYIQKNNLWKTVDKYI